MEFNQNSTVISDVYLWNTSGIPLEYCFKIPAFFVEGGQGDDYTTGCLLDYSYFNNYYKMIAIDLSKQKVFDADPRAIQLINFTANLDRDGNTTMFVVTEEAKETVLDFSQ